MASVQPQVSSTSPAPRISPTATHTALADSWPRTRENENTHYYTLHSWVGEGGGETSLLWLDSWLWAMFEISHLNSVGDIQIRECDVGRRNLSGYFLPCSLWKTSLPCSAERVWCGWLLWDVVISPLEKHFTLPHYKHTGSKGNHVLSSYTGASS